MSRQTRATPLQFAVLLEFMREHADFACGRLVGHDGRNETDRLWDQLTFILNAENGPQKSAAKWQRTWVDWKCSTRSKAGLSRSDRRRAAIDGSSKLLAANLSPLEEQLVAFLEQQSPFESEYKLTAQPSLHQRDLEYEQRDDAAAVEVDQAYEGNGHLIENGNWADDIEVKPNIAADNDVGSTSHETSSTKRRGKRTITAPQLPETEDDESSSSAKRRTTVLDGQHVQSAAMCRVADALEQMASMSAKRNDLEERRLAIQERKIAVYERKALLNERKIAVEERRVATEENLLHCVRTYLQDKKNGTN